MTTLEFLGVYEHTIEKFSTIAENAVTIYIDDDDDIVDELNEEAKFIIFNDLQLGALESVSFTNIVINAYFSIAKSMIEEHCPDVKITYDINNWASSFTVNGQDVTLE